MSIKQLLNSSSYVVCCFIVIYTYGCKTPTESKNNYTDVALNDIYHIRIPDGCILSKQEGKTIIEWNELQVICSTGGFHKNFANQILGSDALNVIKSDTIRNHYLIAYNSSDGYFNMVAYSLEELSGIFSDERMGVAIESRYIKVEEKEFLLDLVEGFEIKE